MDLTSFMKEDLCSKVCSLLPLHSRGAVKQGPYTQACRFTFKGVLSPEREFDSQMSNTQLA